MKVRKLFKKVNSCKKAFLSFAVALVMVFVSSVPQLSVIALSEQDLDTYAQNNILFYDPSENNKCLSDVSVCNINLTEKALGMLVSAKVKEKAERNMERYKYAEEQTGVPWQAIATLHFKEGGMASEKSISNGQPLTTDGHCYKNVDNIDICGDANEDAKQAAEHLKQMASYVYDIDDLSWGSSLEEWGKAFLAYNRGAMYECLGRHIPYTESPYVMNYFDSEHENMVALHADSWNCRNEKVNGLEGSVRKNLGALVVFSYLCGGESGSGGSGNSTNSSSTDGSDVTIIGDSITVGAKDAILEKLPQADIHAQVSKTVGYDFSGDDGENKSGLSIVKELKADNLLRDKVVFLLGTNTSGFDKLQDVISEIGSGKKIYLMSLYGKNNDYASQNETIKNIVDNKSNVTLIDWAAKVKDNADSYLRDNVHPNEAGQEVFVKLIYDAVSSSSSGTCGAVGTDGVSSIEEAQFIIDAYKEDDLSGFGFLLPDTGDYHDNCVAFSIWWINYYTDIAYKIGSYGNGRDVVNNFYNRFKSQYPDLEISNTPSVYSLASWSGPVPNSTAANHTGIIVGIDESRNKIFIAEAGWNNHGFTGTHEYNLSTFTGGSTNQYINLNKYLKSNTGLK